MSKCICENECGGQNGTLWMNKVGPKSAERSQISATNVLGHPAPNRPTVTSFYHVLSKIILYQIETKK